MPSQYILSLMEFKFIILYIFLLIVKFIINLQEIRNIYSPLHSFAIAKLCKVSEIAASKYIIRHICTKLSLQIVQPEDVHLMAETCSCFCY
jgi:hypothetical protein